MTGKDIEGAERLNKFPKIWQIQWKHFVYAFINAIVKQWTQLKYDLLKYQEMLQINNDFKFYNESLLLQHRSLRNFTKILKTLS